MALTRITRGVIKPNENYDTHNIVSTGIVTSVGLDVNGNADVSGNLSVGGVLTYEDVTSIDSLGIITARSGIDADDFISVGSNIHLGNAGVITATSFVGDGSGLIGVASTDNIITGTAATFNTYPVDINAGMTVAGVTTTTDNIIINADNKILKIGASEDIHIFHQGGTSIIKDINDNPINIQSDGEIKLAKDGNAETYARFIPDGAVELYYDNAKKFETTTNGIDITGSSTFAQLKLKTSDGSNRGGLYAASNNALYLLDSQDHQFMHCVKDGEVIIKHDNSNILRTWTSGVEIFGALYATSVDLNDNQKILLGTGDDFEVYHDGSNAVLRVTGDGDLKLLVEEKNFIVQGTGGHQIIKGIDNGAVELYHNNVKKIETTANGLKLPDSTRIDFGDSLDLKIYHHGGNSIIDTDTGDLILRSDADDVKILAEDGIVLRDNDDSTNFIHCINGGAVELYHNGTKRLETTANGVEIANALFVGEKIDMPDHTSGTNGMILLGTGDDLFMYHDGTNSHLRNNTGTFNIRATSFRLTDTAIQHVYLKTNDSGNNDVQLYYDNSVKLTTASAGVQVTGALNVTTTMHIPDSNVGLQFGNSNDMIMYHNGSNSHIQHQGTGSLYIDSLNNSADIYVRSKDNLHLMTNNNAQNSVVCVGNGGVILHNQGNARFNTDHDGAVVTEKRLAINRNAGDPFLQFQTSGTTHATLYGGSSTGFRVFTGGTQTERLRITTDGKFLYGVDTARSGFFNSNAQFNPHFQIEGAGDADDPGRVTSIIYNSTTTAGPTLLFGKTNTGSVGGTGAVANNHGLGLITFQGMVGGQFTQGATISASVSGTPGDNDLPTHLSFGTCADGSASASERVRITPDGKVGINDTTPDADLSVSNSNTSQNAAFVDIGKAGGNRLKLGYEGNNCFFGGSSSSAMFIFKNNVNSDGNPQASGTERMRLTGNGCLNIGASFSQTTYPFHIEGSSNTTAKIKCSGNDTANFFFDANRNGASSNIGLLRGLWNGTSVADIRFLTGIDTSNKDDGKIGFYTASAGTPSLRMVIDQEGTTHFSDNDVRTDIADVVNVKLYNPARFVARNGKHRERGFWSMSTGSGSYNNGYAHMKTNMATNSSTMFVFTMRGYSYGQGKIMFAETCGYCYSSQNNIINTENKSYDGTTTLSTYKSSDGYVCLEVAMNGWSSYYTGFIIDVQYANHAMGAMNYKVISSTWNNTNNHFA